MIPRALLAVALICVAPSASAQQFDNKRPMGETAADAAFGFCPLLLGGVLKLENNDELMSRGWPATTIKASNQRYGELEILDMKFPEGAIAFGGASGKICSVTMTGPGRAAAAKAVRDSMKLSPIPFVPDAASSGPRNGAQIEAFSGQADAGAVMHMQIVTLPDNAPNPATAVQFYITAK